MSTYYFETEPHGALWFAYIYHVGDTKNTAPPAKEFHGQDKLAAAQMAQQWILERTAKKAAPRRSMKASEMAVLAAAQEPNTWHGDGIHAVVVAYDPEYAQFILSDDGYGYGAADDAAEALDAAWQAEDNRRRQATRTARLDVLAQQAGFGTWRRLETAALAGDAVIVAK